MRAIVRSLRSRLVLPVLLAAGPATILVVLTARAWHNHELADGADAASRVAHQAAAAHTRALRNIQQNLATAAAALARDRTQPNQQPRSILRAVAGNFTLFDDLGIFEPDGQIVDLVRPLDPGGERRVRLLADNSGPRSSSRLTAYDADTRGGRVYTVMTAPVPDASAAGARSLFAIVELSWLHDPMTLDGLPAGTVITVRDHSGHVLVRMPQDAAAPPAAGSSTVHVRLPGAGMAGLGAVQSAVTSTAPAGLPGSDPSDDLDMAIDMPTAAETAEADRLLRQTAVALFFSCIFAGAVAWVSSDRLSREVEGLVTTTTRLAGGESTARAAVEGSVPELARLAGSLNTLAVISAQRARDVAVRHDHTLQKLSSALEQTADSVFITDRTGVIEYVNPAFEAMTSYTRDEVVGRTPRLFSSGAHDRRFYDDLWRTILSGRVFRAIVTNRARDGRLFNEDQTITPIRDATGAITHFVSTGRDITNRQRTEAALRRLNGAFENEAARIASVLHDEAGQFLSAAHMTLAELAHELVPEQRTRVQQVRRHLELAEEQLRRVSHELHPRILDDLGLVEAVRFLSSGFGRRNGISVDVDVSIDSSCPRPVETVVYRLVQEGLTNIGKHAHATRVNVVLAREQARVLCSIRDDGVGFDVAAASDSRGGFSLGLALMRDRIEAVCGTLTVVSAAGCGTELHASVPMEI